jgi:hypothetical protein
MLVKALFGFCAGGGRDVSIGEVFEIAEEWNAKRLIGMGYVVAVGGAPAASPESERRAKALAADEISVREPEPEHREPRMRRNKEE